LRILIRVQIVVTVKYRLSVCRFCFLRMFHAASLVQLRTIRNY